MPDGTLQTMARRMIAVIGAADCDASTHEQALEVGRLLAEAQCVLLTGGLAGVMAAASQGAREAGGLVIGLLPGDQPNSANPWVEVALATGAGDARNAMIANSAEAFIAIAGSWGTLSEIAFALKRGKRVVSLNSIGADLPVLQATDPAHAVRLVLAE